MSSLLSSGRQFCRHARPDTALAARGGACWSATGGPLTCSWRLSWRVSPLSREGRGLLECNYTLGRKVHWSGFSSASPDRAVAAQFAGAGGVLLRLRLLPAGSRARDICDLSAIRAESEVRAVVKSLPLVVKYRTFTCC